MDVTYHASPTLAGFHRSDKFIRGLMGPIGSGKSVACCIELMRLSMLQEPNEDGVRRTRWAIIRNTYRELIDTTMKTWFDWFPEELGTLLKKDMKWTIFQELDDGTTLEAEFLFRALDKPDDIKKLLSLELTGAWMNEAREIPKAILDMLMGRVGRFPSMRDAGATWYGVILDTNPPDSDSWWYKFFEVDCPPNAVLFKQPSGIGPDAENRDNLPKLYYHNMQSGKTKEWINVYVHGLYGFVMDGKPVWPQYKDDVHYTDEPVHETFDRRRTCYIGIDFGLTPAATFGTESATGQWIIFDDLTTEDMDAKTFARLLNKHINQHYPDCDFQVYGDPAGDFRVGTDSDTPFHVLQQEGINAWPTYTNDVLIRLEAVSGTLTRMDSMGQPGFIIGPRAKMIRKAMGGGYKYKRMAVTGQERYMDKPDKGRYSHVADSLQYLLLGAGEGGKVIQSKNHDKPIDYSHIDRALT